jgi:hypothetical protein
LNVSRLFCADVSKPLIGRIQEERGTVSLPANCASQSIVDVSENMRAKIYSLFCKVCSFQMNFTFKEEF